MILILIIGLALHILILCFKWLGFFNWLLTNLCKKFKSRRNFSILIRFLWTFTFCDWWRSISHCFWIVDNLAYMHLFRYNMLLYDLWLHNLWIINLNFSNDLLRDLRNFRFLLNWFHSFKLLIWFSRKCSVVVMNKLILVLNYLRFNQVDGFNDFAFLWHGRNECFHFTFFNIVRLRCNWRTDLFGWKVFYFLNKVMNCFSFVFGWSVVF